MAALSPLLSPLSPLLAFGWVNLPMLGWLAAAAAPILIHLWNRRQYREAPWAAMEYLLAAARRQTRRLRFEQWLLLAIRTSLVVLIVLAAAEPYVERPGVALPAGGNTHRTLVLDASYSMAYRPTDKTRFERAKELARQIVDESPQGDAFTLVLLSSPPKVVVGRPALDRVEIVREIDNLRLSCAAADLPATIAAIGELAGGAARENPRLSRHEVHFLTDMQRATWAPRLPKAAAADFLRQTKELAQAAGLFLIDLGQPNAENLAVTGLHAADRLPIVGRPVQLQADLRNFGRQAHGRQPVELLVDRRLIERREVRIDPEGVASVGFSYRFDSPGDHAVEVRAAGDALEVDNRRFLAAPVRQDLRVLCIDGRPSGDPFRGAAGYLAVALDPRAPQADRALVQVEVATENAIRDRNLGGYDCLLLANVAQFTASEARVLDVYLRSGGSLVFFLGDQVSGERYNDELGVAGQGRAGRPEILPAQIGPLVERPQFRLDPLGYRHPIVQPFRGRGEASLLTTPVLKHYKLIVPQNSRAKTVLALGDGDPLVVETPVHRGQVILVATAAEPAWTAMPLWPSFVPLVQEIVAWCAGGELQHRNLLVGEPLDASVMNRADTGQSGIFEARFGPPVNRTETFAVNVDTTESDLTQIGPEQLQNEVWPGVPLIHQTSWQHLGAGGSGGPIRGGSRLHLGLLYAVLGLLFVETFWAWKMGCHGRD